MDLDSLNRSQLIAYLARRHYLEGVSKVDLAEQTHLSRFKIARLLEEGYQRGIIRIQILEPTTNLPMYSEPLRAHLNLEEVRVIDSTVTGSTQRQQVGAMGAEFVHSILTPSQILGFAWGRTTHSAAEQLAKLPAITAIQLTGSIVDEGSQSPIDAMRSEVELAGGSAHAVLAPLYVGPHVEQEKASSDLNYLLGLYDHVDIAVLSIGSWNPPTSQLRRVLPIPLRDRLDAAQPAAELAGIWFDDDGKIICPEVTRQCITVTPHQLRKTPKVVALATGDAKIEAIYAVAKSGLITSLITDRYSAECLLDMDAVTQKALPRLPSS